MHNRLYQKGNGIKILNFTMGSYFGVSDFVYNSPLYNGFINKWPKTIRPNIQQIKI